ncbi:hypothetical protein BJ878DRAFT_532392 [Calycina marina]|uniref:F-box domain-containing protein n=1 Tax=Calycina marina TaxID=1763456 RepID=A0A9P7Z9J9_9HELO|nr:hypothetical protein BJ878DRAFT_532392 [Calycina marina]
MPATFLEVLPREIRDQIYTYVLATPSGKVSLIPWSYDVARSLSVLRVSHQLQRECKAIIWLHNNLSLRPITQLSTHLTLPPHARPVEHVKMALELLDGDELEWAASAIPSLLGWGKVRSITMSSNWERPRNISEFQQELELRRGGVAVDGRLYHGVVWGRNMKIITGWPRFCHWGKQNWLREVLLNVEMVGGLLASMHAQVGGEMWVDGRLCFKDRRQLVEDVRLDPRKGEVKMIFGY